MNMHQLQKKKNLRLNHQTQTIRGKHLRKLQFLTVCLAPAIITFLQVLSSYKSTFVPEGIDFV